MATGLFTLTVPCPGVLSDSVMVVSSQCPGDADCQEWEKTSVAVGLHRISKRGTDLHTCTLRYVLWPDPSHWQETVGLMGDTILARTTCQQKWPEVITISGLLHLQSGKT